MDGREVQKKDRGRKEGERWEQSGGKKGAWRRGWAGVSRCLSRSAFSGKVLGPEGTPWFLAMTKATHSRHFWPGWDPDLALGAAPGSHMPAWCPAGPTEGLGAAVWLRPNRSTAPTRMNPWPQPQTDPHPLPGMDF